MSIGLRIKELRKREGLSQIDFSTKIGVKQSPLSQMESGKILPSLETLSKIIRKFNISYSWLIDGIDEETKSTEKSNKINIATNIALDSEKQKIQKKAMFTETPPKILEQLLETTSTQNKTIEGLLKDKDKLEKENTKLNKKNAQLRQENERLRAIIKDNEEDTRENKEAV